MKVYIKFLSLLFIKSILFVTGILFCLVVIINLLGELEFFKEIDVNDYFPLFLTVKFTSLIFELFLLFLIATQLFCKFN